MLDSLSENTESVSVDFRTLPGCSIIDISERSELARGLFVEILVDGILSNFPSESIDVTQMGYRNKEKKIMMMIYDNSGRDLQICRRFCYLPP
jgi:hypothetical protein